MSRRATLWGTLLAAACGTPQEGTAPPRPSLVFILADDLGWGDVGCYGAPDLRTPVLDRLAAEGVRFTQFYANGPECTPTRTAFLTGRYQQRVGGLECAIGLGGVGRYDDAVRLQAAGELGLPPSEPSLARLLKDAGYATAICGKWHLGYDRKFHPDRHGFDRAFGPLGGAVDYFHHCEPDGTPMLYQDGRPVRREGYLTDLITDEALRFLRSRPASPFFLYVPYTAPHAPYQGPRDRRPAPVPEVEWNRGTRGTYAEMVERMDAGVGAILEALESEGLAGRTLVVFASDNGADPRGWNHPWRGGKGGLFEGGIRVPCIARWPGRLLAGTVADRPAMTMDWTVSFARLAGARPPAGRPFDGVDILEEVERGLPPSPRPLFWRARRGDRTWRAAREGPLKYVSRQDGGKLEEFLFDLERDPAEAQDLSAARPADRDRLKALLADWETRVRPGR